MLRKFLLNNSKARFLNTNSHANRSDIDGIHARFNYLTITVVLFGISSIMYNRAIMITLKDIMGNQLTIYKKSL